MMNNQNLSQALFSKIPPEDQKEILEILKKKPELEKELDDILASKMQAIETQDQKAWQEIIEREVKFLEKIEKNNILEARPCTA